jgi:hypothetical protein
MISVLALMLLTGCGAPKATGEQEAGPFSVEFSTSPSPPVAGAVSLAVRVRKGNSAVPDAKVTAETSMPDMNMAGPTLDLEASGDSYTGWLNMMSGEWRIKVHVTANGDSGDATYEFEVK